MNVFNLFHSQVHVIADLFCFLFLKLQVRSRLTSCAYEFAVQHNLRGGAGCGEERSEIESLGCAAGVLAKALLQRRWLNVNEAGDLVEQDTAAV